jgi:hypothetical protein
MLPPLTFSYFTARSLLKEVAAAAHLDLLGGQWLGRRPGDDVAGGDAVLAASLRATLILAFPHYENPLKPERLRMPPVLTKVAESNGSRHRIEGHERDFAPPAGTH